MLKRAVLFFIHPTVAYCTHSTSTVLVLVGGAKKTVLMRHVLLRTYECVSNSVFVFTTPQSVTDNALIGETEKFTRAVGRRYKTGVVHKAKEALVCIL